MAAPEVRHHTVLPSYTVSEILSSKLGGSHILVVSPSSFRETHLRKMEGRRRGSLLPCLLVWAREPGWSSSNSLSRRRRSLRLKQAAGYYSIGYQVRGRGPPRPMSSLFPIQTGPASAWQISHLEVSLFRAWKSSQPGGGIWTRLPAGLDGVGTSEQRSLQNVCWMKVEK